MLMTIHSTHVCVWVCRTASGWIIVLGWLVRWLWDEKRRMGNQKALTVQDGVEGKALPPLSMSGYTPESDSPASNFLGRYLKTAHLVCPISRLPGVAMRWRIALC